MFEVVDNKISYVEDNEVLGEVTFPLIDGVYNINHTYVSDKLRGKGIGRKLVLMAIDEINKKNGKYICSCDFARSVLESNNVGKE